MPNPIPKGASDHGKHLRIAIPHASARDAFRTFLKTVGMVSGDQVLLPSFIGWSSREGSGVYDPVVAAGLEPVFYRLDERLRIDLTYLEEAITSHNVKVLVIIHYFGFVDPMTSRAIALARNHGLLVLEDEAHAMLTDLVGGASGRQGDAAIFSLHKLLPLATGGMLVWNRPRHGQESRHSNELRYMADQVHNYDLWAISQTRRQNTSYLHDLLAPLTDYIEPLWGMPNSTEVPQTYPVLVKNQSRDDLYFEMNERGFGVVSLYHSLISEISDHEFPASHHVARQIMNLPVHQDVEAEQLGAMVDALSSLIR